MTGGNGIQILPKHSHKEQYNNIWDNNSFKLEMYALKLKQGPIYIQVENVCVKIKQGLIYFQIIFDTYQLDDLIHIGLTYELIIYATWLLCL